MEPLADRAARAAHRHPAAALPLGELARLVQESGTRVSHHVLLRALAADPERFRIVDPWRGPWARLAADRGASRRRRRPNPTIPDLVDGPRVVPRSGSVAWSPGAAGPAVTRLRQSLIRLGWKVDDASPVDLARWYRLVLEGRRVHGRLGTVDPRLGGG